jgi:multiple sugar transport system permease protein
MRRARRLLERLGFGFAVLVLVSPAVLVFLWMLSLSLKTELDNTAWPPVFVPDPPTLDNYREVFRRNDFLLYAWNSVVVSVSATALALAVGVPAGYGIAKMQAMRAAALILVARITPGLSYLIPLFLLFQWLELTGTLFPIVVTHLVITVPIVVWVMISFFEGLPASWRRRRWWTAPPSGRPSATSRCRWRGRASPWRRSSPSSSPGTTSSSPWCWRGAKRAPCRSP